MAAAPQASVHSGQKLFTDTCLRRMMLLTSLSNTLQVTAPMLLMNCYFVNIVASVLMHTHEDRGILLQLLALYRAIFS